MDDKNVGIFGAADYAEQLQAERQEVAKIEPVAQGFFDGLATPLGCWATIDSYVGGVLPGGVKPFWERR